MSMINTNHIRLKYATLGELTLTNDLKEEMLAGASYLTCNLHVLALSMSGTDSAIDTPSTFRVMFDPHSIFQRRYITPTPFHIKMMRNDRMNWKEFKYQPESSGSMAFGCGYIFGNVSNSILAYYDPSLSHDTMLADFIACAFIAGMQGDYQSANMYMAAANMIGQMIVHADDTDQFHFSVTERLNNVNIKFNKL